MINAQNRHMKKYITASIAAIICYAALFFGGCVEFISDSGGYYIPSDLNEFSSITCKAGEKEVKVQKKDNLLIAEYADVSYILGKTFGAEFSANGYDLLDEEEVKNARYDLLLTSGLMYSSLPKEGYIMTDTSGKYRADAEKFFYSAEYMRATALGENTDNLEEYFFSSAAEKYGDMDDYEITLDCSRQNTVTLTIENTKYASSSKFTFTDIDETEVSLTQDMITYLDSNHISA